MSQLNKGKVSPALVVAVLALVAAVAGTAVAGPNAVSSAITKSKVKKIANKQIKKAAPGLSVDNAAKLGGEPAAAYLKDSAVRYASINADGTIQGQAKGITQANVTKDGAGFFCIDGLNPAPQAVTATLRTDALAGAFLYAGLKSGGGVCAGKQIIVQTQNNALTNTDNPFNIAVF